MKLRYYQRDAVVDTISAIESGRLKKPVIVLPTGAGKTLVISTLVQQLYTSGDVLVLSHVKEIIEQNYAAISKLSECSIYSAMIGEKNVSNITIAGVQSAYRKPELFKRFKYVIIDECHLMSDEPDSMYQKLLSAVGEHILIGLTATPYRLSTGYIYESGQFDGVSYNGGTPENYNRLVSDGYLSPLTTKRTKLEMDTSGIKLVGGDYNERQMSDKFDRLPVTEQAIKEIMAAGVNRKCWMIFTIDISHAEHVAEVLIRSGIPTAVIHSKMGEDGFIREDVIQGYKDGKYKCIVNVNILTTGFDHPDIDLIACLRPTKSTVLHVQSLGRGCRKAEGKDNCLVLDFAGNTAVLGNIDNPNVIVKAKGDGDGEAVTKACPTCDTYVAASVKNCPECGHKFAFQHGLTGTAFDASLSDGKPHWVRVDNVTYEVAKKYAGPSTLKVNYSCSGNVYSEWVCIEHSGFARHKANHWVKYRGGSPCDSAEELYDISDKLSTPYEICIQKKGKYTTVTNSNF